MEDFYQLALGHIESNQENRLAEAEKTISDITFLSNIAPEKVKNAKNLIFSNACVALHFHPDRLNPEGISVAECLLKDGYYRNQFETKLSNGQLAPQPGGLRDKWESELFGQDYVRSVRYADRPKYGALDLMRSPEGPSPRFGSCYLILKPEVSYRSTFSYLDSHKNPKEKGTLKFFDDILAAVMTESFERGYALGHYIEPDMLITELIDRLSKPYQEPRGVQLNGNLNHYVEAQVHGSVSLSTDVLKIVCDASFVNTDTGIQLAALSGKFGIPLQWHNAFKLKTSAVPSNFRGPDMPELARSIADDGHLNAWLIGAAFKELPIENNRSLTGYASRAQQLKYLWHVLVKFGC